MDELRAIASNVPNGFLTAFILFLLLAGPRFFERIGLPGLVGLLGAGVLIGPSGLEITGAHDEVLGFLSDLGKLLLMFYAGLEIDLDRFKATKNRSFTFAMLSFGFPLIGGAAVAYLFGYGWLSAILIGSLLASHTLLGYPIVSRLGLVKNEAVTVAVGGTIVTDTAALMVLALCVSIHTTGFSPASLGLQILQLALYVPAILLGVSWFARRLFHRLGNTEADAMIVLLFIVFIGASTAELINLEGIIGAFLTGLAVNRALSGTPAKAKIEFFGNVLFVPSFFLAMGVKLDLEAFAWTLRTNLLFVGSVVGILFLAKWVAAYVTKRSFGYTRDEKLTMWSLSLPQVAATLAAALVAFEAINVDGERLIDEAALNAIIVLMVVTAIVGPILTERFAKRLAASPEQKEGRE